MFGKEAVLDQMPRLARPAACGLLVLLSLQVQACSGSSNSDKVVGSHSSAHVEKIRVALNYSQLEKDGKTCQGGGPRPCAAPLHSSPDYSDNDMAKIVVDSNGQSHREWPFEAYAGKPGDSFDIVCQVESKYAANDAYGNSSYIWDVAEAPAEHVDPQALAHIKDGSLVVGHTVDSQGNVDTVDFLTPNMWDGNHGVYTELAPCTPQQNPRHFSPVD